MARLKESKAINSVSKLLVASSYSLLGYEDSAKEILKTVSLEKEHLNLGDKSLVLNSYLIFKDDINVLKN